VLSIGWAGAALADEAHKVKPSATVEVLDDKAQIDDVITRLLNNKSTETTTSVDLKTLRPPAPPPTEKDLKRNGPKPPPPAKIHHDHVVKKH
jgi:hypothetical protein